MATTFSVGEPVIINETEQPCAYLVAVVVAIEGDRVRTKYLCSLSDFDKYNKRGCVSEVAGVTTLETFGVELRQKGKFYTCVVVGESSAKYSDGSPRRWQERDPGLRWPFREDVMRLARKRGK